MITDDLIIAALSKVIEPELHKDLITLKMVENIKINDVAVVLTVILTTPGCPL